MGKIMSFICNDCFRKSMNQSKVAQLLMLCLFFGSLVGCGASTTSLVADTSFHAFNEQELEKVKSSNTDRYHIRAGDSIDIDFKYEDDLDKQNILVLPDGRINFSGVDDVKAAGLTVAELDTELTAHFAKDYRNPQLSVIIREMGAQEVFVYGEVSRPGAYELKTLHGNLLQSIALAGGFTKDASTAEVLLIRIEENGYRYQIADISHMEKRAPMGLVQLDIQANDIIYVPRSALGDLSYFSDTFLQAALRVTDIFWDIYAITHLNKIDRIIR